MMLPRVLLADDHGIFAEGLQRLLTGHAQVVGRLDGADDLEGEAGRVHPDVILLDLSMPGIGGLEALRSLRAARHPAKVIILTMHADPRLAAECLRVGAAGFVLKQSSGDELVSAIQEVMRGHTYLTPRLTGDVFALMAEPPAAAPPALTDRQRQVLGFVVEGRRMKEIASLLSLSPRTVETVKYELMRLLGVHSTAELVRFAIQHRLVQVDFAAPPGS
jgi:DNA-binding NarL/FixJ family response regulator